MKLWHDDIRPAPEGWVWARTNEEAKKLLATGDVKEISLDHDLGLAHLDPKAHPDLIYFAGRSQDGSGLDLVHWMCDTGHVPEKIMIHSWNPDGAKAMAARFNHFGYSVTIAPFRATLL